MSEVSVLMKSVMQGRLDFFRSCATCGRSPEASFQNAANGTVYYSTGMNYAPCNGVMEQKEKEILTEKEIEEATAFFNARNIPFIWWTASKSLENKGFQFGGTLTGIALDISQGVPVPKEFSAQSQIKIVESESDVRTFSELAANAFGMDAASLKQFQDTNYVAMKRGEQIHFLAYVNGIPVGAATLSALSSSAGIWNLATLPEYRKGGVGGALVYAALIQAQKRHYNEVMAILMPKGMAWGLFTKLGFEEVCQFPFYVHGVAADALEK